MTPTRMLRWLVLLVAAWLASVATADIRTTPHSLIKKSVKPDASDVCVFCHTPTVSGTPPEKAPLWQSSINKNMTFTIYDDIGRLGLDKPSVGSQSIACLSCHDANQARAISKTSADHPFGIPYRGAIKGRQPAIDPLRRPVYDPENPMIWAKNLVGTEDFRDVSQGTVENRTVWWVSKTGTVGRRTRNDLPLYTRDDGTGQDLPFIECSSCHDPHTSNKKFLRLVNEQGSQLCLTCHIK